MNNNVSVQTEYRPPKKRKFFKNSLDKKKARAGWIFVLPFVIGLILMYLPVLYNSIVFSFAEMNTKVGGGYTLTWVGLDNYKHALMTDTKYISTLGSSLGQMAFDIVAIVMFSLFIAVLLNQKMRGRAIFRMVFFIPVVITAGIIAKIDNGNALLNSMGSSSMIDMGGEESALSNLVNAADLTRIFENLGIGTELVEKVTGIVTNIYDIVNRSGVQMLLFLAGLQSISPAIYESCSIDGATGWETFWKITFPMISPIILVNTVYTVIDSFTAESNEVMQYILGYENEMQSGAMAWMYFMIVLIVIALVLFGLSFFVFYQRRDK